MNRLIGENWSRSPQKRRFDVAIVLSSLPIILPVNTALICMVGLVDRHIPIFTQSRLGQDEKKFLVHKIRTISPGTMEVPSGGQSQVPGVTRLGQLLRKNRLDEFPQALNILKGEMSVVGVRPLMSQEIEISRDSLNAAEFKEWTIARATMRPGLCDPFSMQTLSDTAFDEQHSRNSIHARVASDIEFAYDKTSLEYDCELLGASILTALSRTISRSSFAPN